MCANKIGVLGLVDYQTLERRDCNTNITKYTEEFTSATKQLVGYFNDRICYWEFLERAKLCTDRYHRTNYADLLIATHDAIKAVDSGDQVLFAGLAQAAQNSKNYFDVRSVSIE